MFLKLFLAICICGAIYGLNKKGVFSGLFDSDSVKSQANNESKEADLANKRKDRSSYYLTGEDLDALIDFTNKATKNAIKKGSSIKRFTTPSGQIVKVNIKRKVIGYCRSTKSPNSEVSSSYDRPIIKVDF